MGEKKSNLNPFEVRYYCDCGQEMKPTGIELLSMPPKYPHICEGCGRKENLSKIYPNLGFGSKKSIE